MVLKVTMVTTFKVCLFAHKAMHAEVPEYLEPLIQVYHPAVSSLRRAKDKYLLAIPPIPKSKSKLCERQFSQHAPVLWNNLPFDIRSCSKTETFKTQLKTYFFRQVFKEQCGEQSIV